MASWRRERCRHRVRSPQSLTTHWVQSHVVRSCLVIRTNRQPSGETGTPWPFLNLSSVLFPINHGYASSSGARVSLITLVQCGQSVPINTNHSGDNCLSTRSSENRKGEKVLRLKLQGVQSQGAGGRGRENEAGREDTSRKCSSVLCSWPQIWGSRLHLMVLKDPV